MENILLKGALVLLAVAALLGFAQYRHRDDPERFARWRVVHAGGCGGAVQLLALLAAHHFWGLGPWSLVSLSLVTLSTWAFFFGPLAQALERPHLGARINVVGSFFAVPGYLALPFAFAA